MFYVLDENNNKIEALDKEGVFAALEKAIADGSLADLVADSAFVSKLKCCVSGKTNKIAFVTEAKYNEMAALGTVENGVYYYITDDTSIETIDKALTDLNAAILSAEKRITDIENGAKFVPNANYAKNAGTAASASLAEGAEFATFALYASEDADKGTIEERLTELAETVEDHNEEIHYLKAENRLYIPKDTLNPNNICIYDSSKSTQERISLTLLNGVLENNIIGYSGSIEVSFDNANWHKLYFSVLRNIYDYKSGTFDSFIYANQKLYWVQIELGIDTNNKLYISGTPKCYNIAENKEVSISKIRPEYLWVYYK